MKDIFTEILELAGCDTSKMRLDELYATKTPKTNTYTNMPLTNGEKLDYVGEDGIVFKSYKNAVNHIINVMKNGDEKAQCNVITPLYLINPKVHKKNEVPQAPTATTLVLSIGRRDGLTHTGDVSTGAGLSHMYKHIKYGDLDTFKIENQNTKNFDLLKEFLLNLPKMLDKGEYIIDTKYPSDLKLKVFYDNKTALVFGVQDVPQNPDSDYDYSENAFKGNFKNDFSFLVTAYNDRDPNRYQYATKTKLPSYLPKQEDVLNDEYDDTEDKGEIVNLRQELQMRNIMLNSEIQHAHNEYLEKKKEQEFKAKKAEELKQERKKQRQEEKEEQEKLAMQQKLQKEKEKANYNKNKKHDF